MKFTKLEREVAEYCDRNEFISMSIFDNFFERLKEEDAGYILLFEMEKFTRNCCPKCNTHGFYKSRFLGKLKHPDCGYEWYMSPVLYIKRQLRGIFNMARGITAITEDEGKESGCLETAMSFAMGLFIAIVFRLPFAIILILIQIPISLLQKKPTD